MRVCWLPQAANALDEEFAFLARRNPDAARRVFQRIVLTTRRLSDFPASGRQGHVPDTRELVVSGLPYVIVYKVRANAVEILRVFHTARDWPAAFQNNHQE